MTMAYVSESQEITERFSGEMDDLRTIARMHGLKIGTTDALLTLPLQLAQDARLRSDLTELIRSLQTGDRELGLADVQSLLLVAVGGPRALQRQADLDEPVDLIGGFLASLGGWPGSFVEPLIDIDNPPDHDPRLDLAPAHQDESTGALQEPREPEPPPAALPEEPHPAFDPNGPASLAEITHALARLERGNHELRLHLDSIDQRICRMEPLLESVPHAGAPPNAPREEVTIDRTASELPPSSAGLLSHRTPAASTAPPERDLLDEAKEIRRISLKSAFVPENLVPAPPASLRESVSAPPPPPGVVEDPVSHPRIQLPPRRDRFAAAREIPGTPADQDPLYTAPEEEVTLTPRSPIVPSSVASTRPSPSVPLQEPTPPPVRSEPATAASSLLQSPPDRRPDLAPKLEYLNLAALAEPAPIQATVPAQSTVSGQTAELETLPRVAAQRSAPSPQTEIPMFQAWKADDAADENKGDKRRPWLAGGVAAIVLGAAGFLYVNGLPSGVTQWIGGGRSEPVSSGSAAAANPAGTADRRATSGEGPDAASAAGSAQPGKHTARQAESRDESSAGRNVITAGPTFVPGPVMDGHLISAPRPVYPELAKLVGAQGKISLDAMISKSGEVEAVKVLGGPHVLRDAATEAVKKWQYRPFLLNGRPVEVRTIIRVDVASRAGSAPSAP